jgi:hypothetical protein
MPPRRYTISLPDMRRIHGPRLMIMGALLAALCPAASAAPRLVLSSVSVTVGPIPPGSTAQPLGEEAQNAGDGSLNLTATSSASWISATIGAAGPCRILSGTCNQIAITLATSVGAGGWHVQRIRSADRSQRDRQPSGNRVECHGRGCAGFNHLVRRPLRIGRFDSQLVHLSGQHGFRNRQHHQRRRLAWLRPERTFDHRFSRRDSGLRAARPGRG